jgi:TonB family protein
VQSAAHNEQLDWVVRGSSQPQGPDRRGLLSHFRPVTVTSVTFRKGAINPKIVKKLDINLSFLGPLNMRARHPLILFVLLPCCFMALRTAQSQSSSPETRRVVRKSLPQYPEIAKRMNLVGTVKVLATVAPDGTVKSVQPMGGSPVLIQSASDAVSKWKFAPASAESKELIELHFDPQ